MASTAQRSSFISLYSVEDVTDDAFKVQIENKQALVKFNGSQPLELNFSSYTFKSPGESDFNLENRFSALESDSTANDNAAAITQLQSDLAAEAVSRQSADTSNNNLITAEVNNRVSAVAGVQSNLDSEVSRAIAAENANTAAISAEETARIIAVANESSRAQAAEVALGVRIDNLLSNADPASLDSLSELLTAFQNADNSLSGSLNAALARIQVLEDIVSELTSA